MKRILILALALALLCATGLCETRQSYVVLEGEAEPVLETLCESGLGFSFWYDAERLTVDADMSESGASLMIYPDDDDLLVYVELLTPEAIGMDPWDFLLEAAAEDAEFEEDTAEGGALMTWVSVPPQEQGGFAARYYVIEDDESALAAYASWPLEAEEGWGKRLHAVLRTLTFDSSAAVFDPVSVLWLGAVQPEGDVLVVDEDGAYVAIIAREAITGFKLLSLQMTDFDEEGNISFDTEVLAQRDSLSPADAPLTLKLAFPGDIPSYGIEFTDDIGETLRYALGISGRDGSLVLSAF